MCEVCAVFGIGAHWSDAPSELDKKFPAKDIQTFRGERAERLALINALVEPMGLKCFDWDGERYAVVAQDHRQLVADNMTQLWQSVRTLAGRVPEPLQLGQL